MEYETIVRLHARGLDAPYIDAARELLERRDTVHTLDALHLASIGYPRSQREDVALATYDRRLAQAAEAPGIATVDVG